MPDEFNPYVSTSADLSPSFLEPTDGLRDASRGARLGAALLDVLPAALLCVFAALAIPGIMQRHQPTAEPPAAAAMVLLALLVVGWGGFNIILFHRSGQTFGKKLLGIRVVRSDGSRVSVPRWLILRGAVVGVFSKIPFVGWIVPLVDSLMIFRDDRRCLHDQIADTRVVEA